MPLSGLQVRQLAYFVPDIEAAALRHHQLFGSGPYFLARHVELASCVHRGVRTGWDHSSAYGQWGEVMVEFLTQHNDGPSACHDLFPRGSGRFGLHHTAIFVQDIDTAIEQFEQQGMPLAQHALVEGGTRFAFVDASAELGHMIELYEPCARITGFYAMVREGTVISIYA